MNFPLIVYNLKNGNPFKIVVHNIREKGLLQWLLNELSPSSWLNSDQKLAWVNLQPEMIGWGKHIIIGVAFTLILRIHPVIIILFAFAYEIYTFLLVDAAFLHPVNACIDIFFYFLGSYIIWTHYYKKKLIPLSGMIEKNIYWLWIVQTIRNVRFQKEA